jgi:hypothetical protein
MMMLEAGWQKVAARVIEWIKALRLAQGWYYFAWRTRKSTISSIFSCGSPGIG